MTVHAVEIVCSPDQESSPDSVPSPEPPALEDVLPERVEQNVLNSLEEVLPEQATAFRKVNTEMDGSGVDYMRGVRRISSNHGKGEVLDSFEQGVVADCKWYEIRFHECTHDDSARIVEKTRELPDGSTETYTEEVEECGGWQTERSKGTVPDGV